MNNKRLSKWIGIAGAVIILGVFVVFLCVKAKNSIANEAETSETISLPTAAFNDLSEIPSESVPVGPGADPSFPDILYPEDTSQPS